MPKKVTTTNLFAAAEKIAAPKNAPRKKKAPSRPIIGMESLAAIDATIKMLLAAKEHCEKIVKSAARRNFIETGIETGEKPSNFDGIEGIGTGNCQLKIRPITSPLLDSELKLLEPTGLPLKTIVRQREAYIINPKYMHDQEFLANLSRTISKMRGLPPDLIQLQPESKAIVVDDKIIDVLFHRRDEKIANAIIDTISTVVVKPKIAPDKIAEAIKIALAIGEQVRLQGTEETSDESFDDADEREKKVA